MQRNKRKTWGAIFADTSVLGQLMQPQVVAVARRTEPHWERSIVEWTKCNTDGAFYDQQWKGATCAVLRDDTGTFVRGGTKWYDHRH